MKQCKCGSFALNLDDNLCDVCYWKNKHDKLKAENEKLIQDLSEINDLVKTIGEMDKAGEL